MHAEAKAFIAGKAATIDVNQGNNRVHFAVDLGGRETNGHARDVFPAGYNWIVVDAVEGPGVDVVANAAYWQPTPINPTRPAVVDLVMCAEVFEHTPYWAKIIHNAWKMLRNNGYFICTMAGPGRAIHGVNHDDPDQPGHYENIQPRWLEVALHAAGFCYVEVSENKASYDVYGYAVK